MSGRKFEYGKTYEGRITKDLYECKFSGDYWAVFKKGSTGAECAEMQANIAHYKEVTPKKTGTTFLLVYVHNRLEDDAKCSVSFSDRKSLNIWVEGYINSITILAIKEVPWTEGDGVGETKKD